MILLGVFCAAVAGVYLIVSYARAQKSAPYPAYGLIGLAVIALAELLLYLDVEPVITYFTPLAWTGYILAVDAAVFSVRGRSLLRSAPEAFVWMAVLSIFLWLVFEVYNLRLHNWTYVGLPRNLVARYLGYGWSFATIWPAILETAEFLLATQFRRPRPQNERAVLRKSTLAWNLLGLLMVTIPVLVPREWGVYLFGSVWLGFIFLIDPLNYRAQRPSVWGDLALGYRSRLWALALAGLLCGIFWEFWNYWAAAKWLYIFPIFEEWVVFEMPLLGFLGFPPFAVEVFALYIFSTSVLDLPSYETR